MRYYVTLPSGPRDSTPDGDPQVHQVDVQVRPNGELVVSIGDRTFENDVVVLDDGSLSIRIDGKVLDLTVEGTPPDVGVIASGHRSYVRVESERHRAAQAAKGGGSSATEKTLAAPMPGRVAKLLCAVGDEVKPGQGVIVIEAMKMENELKSKSGGTVAEIHVQPGATIESGAKLISFA